MKLGSAQVIRANSRHLPLADNSVDLVVTSPPYFALRSYQDGGEHYAGQIGDEPTPDEFVDSLLEVTRECVRVLKPSGSLWVNLGDKYAGQGPQRPSASALSAQSPQSPSYPSPSSSDAPHSSQVSSSSSSGMGPLSDMKQGARNGNRRSRPEPVDGVRGKSLIGIPWRYALACIDDLGLILRAEVIWSKPNGLPESVTDRVRRSHEQWFHFTLEPRYFSAIDHIREPHVREWGGSPNGGGYYRDELAPGVKDSNLPNAMPNPLGKLPGSVWTVPTEPLRVPDHLGIDHFAAFPTEWPKRIIQGWSPAGVCVECGEGRRPVTSEPEKIGGRVRGEVDAMALGVAEAGGHGFTAIGARSQYTTSGTITGYVCACPEPTAPTTPAVVLDPFGGTGTTAMVAKALGRHGITVDMSSDYCRLAEWRTNDRNQLAKVLGIAKTDEPDPDQLDLFGGDAA